MRSGPCVLIVWMFAAAISSSDRVPVGAAESALAARLLPARARLRVLDERLPGVDRIVVLARALPSTGRAARRGCTGTSRAAGCRDTRSTRCRAGSRAARRAGAPAASVG